MQKEAIAQLMPAIFRSSMAGADNQTDMLTALLAVMEQLHQKTETELDQLHHRLDPDFASRDFLPFLAHWLGLGALLAEEGFFAGSAGQDRLRNLLTEAAHLSHFRGTRYGITRLLEAATGVSGFHVDEHATLPFHIVIHYLPAGRPFHNLIERIIQLEKPAYVTYELHKPIASSQRQAHSEE